MTKKEYNKAYYIKNKELIKEKQCEYVSKNKEQTSVKNKNWKEKNKDKVKSYYKDNREKLIIKRRLYIEKNRNKIREYDNLNQKLKRQNNPLFKLKGNLRNIIRKAIVKNGYTKKTKTFLILGCSYEEFKLHLETQFLGWMTWDNYGLYNGTKDYGWDIDHIKPLVTAITEADIIQLNHYTNLQPLCSKVNRDIKRDLF